MVKLSVHTIYKFDQQDPWAIEGQHQKDVENAENSLKVSAQQEDEAAPGQKSKQYCTN